jgi:hypothetical protein
MRSIENLKQQNKRGPARILVIERARKIGTVEEEK